MLRKSLQDRAPGQFKSGPGIIRLVGVTVYCTVLNNNSPPPRQFLRTNTLKENLRAEMLTDQIIKFQSMGTGPLVRICTPITGLFHDETKLS